MFKASWWGAEFIAYASLVAIGGGLVGFAGIYGYVLGAKAVPLAQASASVIIGTVFVATGCNQIINQYKKLEEKVIELGKNLDLDNNFSDPLINGTNKDISDNRQNG